VRRNVSRLLLCAAIVAACAHARQRSQGVRFEIPTAAGARYFRGNTHTHTTESDGDSPPDVVARWYRDHGYDFLVLSDHNKLTDPKRTGVGSDTFLLITGEELTVRYLGTPVHVNGLNIPAVIEPRQPWGIRRTLQANIDAVRQVGGVPHVNHPNWKWAFGDEILADIENNRLLEIFNGCPDSNNDGDAFHPSMEVVWDRLLTLGQRVYGIAVDDAHHFKDFAPSRMNPGRGWVAVKAQRLEASEIMRALDEGQFYASTGIVLDDVVVTPQRLEIRIRANEGERFRTHFIGGGGRLLAVSTENPAIYDLAGPEQYVRADVYDAAGRIAWVQPTFLLER
jgi:hypothetical protein